MDVMAPSLRVRSAAVPEPLAASTGALLGLAARRALDVVEAGLAPHGIRMRQYSVLAALATDGPAAQGELGARLRIDRTTMVSLIDSLEELQMVERGADPRDRRAYQVRITEHGRETAQAASQAIATAEEALFGPLGGKDWRRLHGLLRRLCGLDADPATTELTPEESVAPAADQESDHATAGGKGEKQRKGKGKRGKK